MGAGGKGVSVRANCTDSCSLKNTNQSMIGLHDQESTDLMSQGYHYITMQNSKKKDNSLQH